MWKKIKDFLDVKPPCYYEAEIQHIMFKCMQREMEHNQILWTVKNHNQGCITGVGSLIKN